MGAHFFASAVTQELLQLTTDYDFGGKQIHDANIVATMQAYEVPCLLTHNVKDFASSEKFVG